MKLPQPSKVLKLLLVIILLLFIAQIIVIIADYSELEFNRSLFHRLFDFDTEKNIPTLFSFFCWIAISIIIFVITGKIKKSNKFHIHWLGLAFIFFYFGLDELFQFHERLFPIMHGAFNTSGIFYFGWFIPYSLLIIVFSFIYFKLYKSIPRPINRLFILSLTIFLSGAIGFEMIGGYCVEVSGKSNMQYRTFSTIEELLEMIGLATFIYALLLYLTKQKLLKK